MTTTTWTPTDAIKHILDNEPCTIGNVTNDVAVALRLAELEAAGADPEDCIWDDQDLMPLWEALRHDSFREVDSRARALLAAVTLCRALQREEREAGEAEATTLECSGESDYLRRLLSIFSDGYTSV